MEDRNFKVGDKVINLWRQERTVALVRSNQIFVDEESNSWYHPTKLRKVKK